VRRLEGHVLHPRRDWRGVHRFDFHEVEQLRATPQRMRAHSRSKWLMRIVTTRAKQAAARSPAAAKHDAARWSMDRLALAVHLLVESATPARLSSSKCVVPTAAVEELLEAAADCF
jgi:hypothetical protein